MRVPQPTSPPPDDSAAAAAEPSTCAALGLSDAATASAIILSGSLIARLTPEAMTGLPANRPRSLTPTSVAKMTASAPAIVAAASGVLPEEPCVSTTKLTPARSAASFRASAAM